MPFDVVGRTGTPARSDEPEPCAAVMGASFTKRAPSQRFTSLDSSPFSGFSYTHPSDPQQLSTAKAKAAANFILAYGAPCGRSRHTLPAGHASLACQPCDT